MKFSMNGYRRNLSNDIEVLRDVVEKVVNGDYYENSELIEAMNDVIRLSNSINCVHYGDDPDFSDMSTLELAFLDESNTNN